MTTKQQEHIEDLTALSWCMDLLTDPSVTHITQRFVPDASDTFRVKINRIFTRALFTDETIRAFITLHRPGNGITRKGNPKDFVIENAPPPFAPPPELREREIQRQARKEEKVFDITDPNGPETVFLVSAGGDINGGINRLHGGILSTLLDHCMGLGISYIYGALAPATTEMTIKFKKPMPAPSVFMLRTKVKKEIGRWFETVGWVEDGHGNVYAEGSANFIIPKLEESKL
ncbi:hypothetical protein DDE82_001806 [Stemphylium lycopersici]|uniref:Thioesterase domain-containing protein n=1 Tax=Stemphylium lycopersici TaxID=183478 RepID=A0A364N9K5_STELY|nr:hypothetical protein TW65_06563 [Stemphylium lycopersici]RAR09296.1 hypothetical protein DDE82_001806 [Stemphylium lycopersici]RAR13989.1 hypothetical protein DDE83_002558 [Stemphylium lycopersici]